MKNLRWRREQELKEENARKIDHQRIQAEIQKEREMNLKGNIAATLLQKKLKAFLERTKAMKSMKSHKSKGKKGKKGKKSKKKK